MKKLLLLVFFAFIAMTGFSADQVEDLVCKELISRKKVFGTLEAIEFLPSTLRPLAQDAMQTADLLEKNTQVSEESTDKMEGRNNSADGKIKSSASPFKLRHLGLIPSVPPQAPQSDKIIAEYREKLNRKSKDYEYDNPPSCDNSAGLPPVGDQGAQGSCVSWAIGYYLKTYQEGKERGWSMTDPAHQFSPAFLYNQLQLYDEGSTFPDTLNLIENQGSATLATMPYSDMDHFT